MVEYGGGIKYEINLKCGVLDVHKKAEGEKPKEGGIVWCGIVDKHVLY